MTVQLETLGPAEHILQALLQFSSHLHHGRPGIVSTDPTSPIKVKWEAATHKTTDGVTTVFRVVGKAKTQAGILQPDNRILDGNRVVGVYRKAGLFEEAGVWIYEQIAKVWEMNNEFAARWASYAFAQDHRDLKMALAAFMLCQSRAGLPVQDNGVTIFKDEDYRNVGEAMMLIRKKDGLDAKYLLRIRNFLSLPGIAQINRRLGFGKSTRRPFLGRWGLAVEKWLEQQERNPKLLQDLITKGFRTTVIELAKAVGYKPETPNFFQKLRWKQVQAEDGRRTIAIGEAVSAAESWQDLREEQVCRKITKEKPSWKRVLGLLGSTPPTKMMVAAAMDVNLFSDKDLIILTETLEDMGLLANQTYREKWEAATRRATDLRAINIARNVRSTEIKEKLQEAADTALKAKFEAPTRNLRIYFIVDISTSMTMAVPEAMKYLTMFLQGFPLERLHVSVFNTFGRVVEIKHASKAGVEAAFKGIQPSGATAHAMGVRALAPFKPQDNEDCLFIFLGDEGQAGTFEDEFRNSDLRASAFGLIKFVTSDRGEIVQNTAKKLGIPCIMLNKEMFQNSDPYAIPRTLAAMIAATPVQTRGAQKQPPRKSLLEIILATDLLVKPAWAA